MPDPVFFDRAAAGPGAISIVAAGPNEIVSGSIFSEADWETLRRRIAARRRDASRCDDPAVPCGMAAGYVEYDGRFRFGFYGDLIAFRHADETWFEVGEFFSRLNASAPGAATSIASQHDIRARTKPSFDFQPEIRSRGHFRSMVARALEYIAAGDIYQVNLSQRFVSPWSGADRDALRFLAALRERSPAPRSAWLQSPERTILSCSPELFLRMRRHHVETHPIKGTRPRFADPVADGQSARELLASAKEAAELVMITDLERNDLGQVCRYGTVAVRDLLKLERFAQVFHLVSTVDGWLRPEVDHASALRACFPGGSITGAPKKRAREIIASLEPVPRGLYTGAIGYFGFNDVSEFSVAIRTVVLEKSAGGNVAHFHVGAGIVADSDPDFEYEETLHKAAGILLAAGDLCRSDFQSGVRASGRLGDELPEREWWTG